MSNNHKPLFKKANDFNSFTHCVSDSIIGSGVTLKNKTGKAPGPVAYILEEDTVKINHQTARQQ